jgi:hypothetical protein
MLFGYRSLKSMANRAKRAHGEDVQKHSEGSHLFRRDRA